MNRKNTILIAVAINAGLLAVLLVAALTTQDDLPSQTPMAREEIEILPKFDELPLLANLEPLKQGESISAIEPVLHTLPPLVSEAPPQSVPIAKLDLPSAPINQVVVKKGDSLEKIARANQTTVDEIIKLNHLPSSFLKIGQILKIPAERLVTKGPEKKTSEMNPEYYTIKVGENPWAIANRYHMKLDELLKLNGLNEEKARKLKPGDRLRIR